MSKRPLEESREERWLRKMKMYEEKIEAKRLRHAERERQHGESERQQNIPAVPRDIQSVPQDAQSVSRDVQSEEHPKYNEMSARPDDFEEAAPAYSDMAPNNSEIAQDDAECVERARQDVAYDEVSLMTETTACTSPNSYCEDNNECASTDDFDPQLLRELGDVETDPVEFGENLQTDVAARFQKNLLDGIKKETKEELLKKYQFPKNVPLAKSPTLNPEIGAMLAETCKLRDKRLLAKQDQLGKALSALGKALTGLLKKTPNIPEVIRILNDAGMLFADSHYAETDTRRSVIIPLIDKSLMDPFKDRKRDSFLFGDKLGDLVKDSRGLKKTGQLIQPSTSFGSNLNARGPSSRGARQSRGGGQTYQHRAVGPRAATTAPAYPYHSPYPYPNRRRAAATMPPPPPAPRRQPAPPPPPARRPPAPAQRSTASRQA